jgi:hypothetical protein
MNVTRASTACFLFSFAVMANPTPEPKAAPAPPHRNGRGRRPEPNPLGGNFILMPSLLEYLSPDLTLPEQYFDRQRMDDGMGAEKSLMYAVLKDGIRCFYKHVGATRRKYRKMSAEAEEWLLEDTYDYAFSFRVICETLSIDADALRSRLMVWKEAELERRRVTGDTKSVQVGRSPFPSPLAELDDLGDADSSSPEDEWEDMDNISLEEYGHFEQVA